VIAPRGKVLGGSSSINGLIYIRGQAEDFNHWRQLGNSGWSFDDVLPYFRRAEHQERGEDALHGVGGPLAVSNVCEPHTLCEAFIEAAQQAGYPRNDDFNGPTQEGAGYFQLTAKNGRRWSTAVGYLREARRRPNLVVETNALASRLLFEGRRAVGVEYRKDGAIRVAHAAREVILAGGAFNSPQLMQLSGLGPADLLRGHGVDVVADMPGVGAELQDHLQVRIQYRCTEPITMNDVVNSWRHRIGAGLRYALLRKGLLAIGAGYAGGFFRTGAQVATPDVQAHFIIFSGETSGAALHPFPGFIASICQLRPESRGFVRIKSANPAEAPAIQPRYLSDPIDRDTVVAGLKLLRGIMEQPAMRRYIAEERVPGPQVTSDTDLLAFARSAGTTVFHPTSTCRMGADANAVVDERLRVRGIGNLRVVDASIMPTVVSGNTNAAVVMIAEKGADMILQDAVAAKPVAEAVTAP
jgi:choline dehydrogenase